MYLMSYVVDCARNVELFWPLLERIAKSLERVRRRMSDWKLGDYRPQGRP